MRRGAGHLGLLLLVAGCASTAPPPIHINDVVRVKAAELLAPCEPTAARGEVAISRHGLVTRLPWRPGLTVRAAQDEAGRMASGPIANISSLVRQCRGGRKLAVHPFEVIGGVEAFATIATRPGDAIVLADW